MTDVLLSLKTVCTNLSAQRSTAPRNELLFDSLRLPSILMFLSLVSTGCVLRNPTDSQRTSASQTSDSEKASMGLKGKPLLHVFGSRNAQGKQRYVGQITLESCSHDASKPPVTSDSLVFSTEVKTLWNTSKTVFIRYTRTPAATSPSDSGSSVAASSNIFVISQPTAQREKSFETSLAGQRANSHLMGLFSDQLNALCQSNSRAPSEIQLNHTETEYFSSLLQDSTNDCLISFEEIGPRCHTSTANTLYLAEALQALRKLTVQQSNRHPYYLARRLGSAIQFAEFLDAIKRKDSTTIATSSEKFCKLMRFSKPDEWPLALQTDSFRRVVCSSSPLNTADSEAFLDAAFVYSKQELELMTLLLKSLTHSGMISVNLTAGEIAPKISRDLRIVLKPSVDVFAKITQKLRDNNLLSGNASQKGTCWHPYFDDSRTAQLATSIGLIHSHPTEKCHQTIGNTVGKNAMEADRYLLSALASETEFVLTNGKGKVIRLPVGNYTFEIFPDTDDRAQNSKLLLSESFEWQNRAKPMIAIRNSVNDRVSH